MATGLLDVFQSHAFLAELSPQHRMILASGVRPFRCDKGQLLAKTGEAANAFYLIQSGHVSVEMNRPGRGPIAIQTIPPGEVIGWSWAVPGHRWQFDCRALNEVKGLSFDANWLRDKCEQDHELGYHLLRQLVKVTASRLNAARRQILDLCK